MNAATGGTASNSNTNGEHSENKNIICNEEPEDYFNINEVLEYQGKIK
jgi:hypothetical protein